MKRTLSLILSLVMVMGIITSLPVTVSAASESDLAFTLNDDGESYSVTDFDTSAEGEIVIPDTYNGLPVTSIGDYAFYDCNSLTSITIPNSVTSIVYKAFYNCTSLISITIPDSVTSIGYRAFYGCTSLTSITIPDSVTNIGDSAFNKTGYYDDTSNWVNDVLYIGNHLIEAKTSLSGSYEIKNGIKVIPGFAFEDCNSLTSITIPNSVTSIGGYAFYNCTSLASITIPDSVTSIGDYAFYNTVFYNDEANWENDVLYIGNHLIRVKDTVSGKYEVKEGTKTISYRAFQGCSSVTSVTIPDSVEFIGYGAFIECENLTSIVIPDSVTYIGAFAFYLCKNLSTVKLSKKTTEIQEYLFYKCPSIRKIVIPEGVTSIGYCAFAHCTGLESVEIPGSVTSIGGCVFEGCYGLKEINVDTGNKNYRSIDGVLFNKKQDVLKIFPASYSKTKYRIPDTVTEIAYSSFCGASSLSEISIPSSVKSIGEYAFAQSNIKYVFFNGTEQQWNSIMSYGSKPTHAKMHYEATDHTLSKWITDKKATCTKEGSKHKECTVCGEILETVKIEKTKHTAGSWITDKKATVNAAGSKYQKCTVCGTKIKTVKIAQLKCAAPKLKAVANVATGIKFTWNKVAGADKYEVYRKVGKNAWKKIATVKGTVTTYTDKNVKSGTTYKYTVKAKNEAGVSKYNTTGLTIKCLADPVLKAPTSAKKGITLKWNKVTGAQGYVVYRKAGNGKLVKLATVKGVSKISYVDKKAKKGTKYTYQIKAYSGKTYSAYSNAKTIKDKY